nr:uncharacterized protein LOC114924579 [Arachis hypogaea]
MSLFLVYSALCGQCLLHWACQTYGIVRLEALGISSLLGYHCHYFSLFLYLPTFNNMVSLQTPTCQCRIISNLMLWLLMDLYRARMEGSGEWGDHLTLQAAADKVCYAEI